MHIVQTLLWIRVPAKLFHVNVTLWITLSDTRFPALILSHGSQNLCSMTSLGSVARPRYPTNLPDEWISLLIHRMGSEAPCSAFTCSDKPKDRSVNVPLKPVVKLTVISALLRAKVQCGGQGFIPTTQETHLVPLLQSIDLSLQRMMRCSRGSGSVGIKPCGHARPLW